MVSINEDNFDTYYDLTMLLGAYHFKRSVTRDELLPYIHDNPNEPLIPSEECLDNQTMLLNYIIKLRSELVAFLRDRSRKSTTPTLVELLLKQDYLFRFQEMNIETDLINSEFTPENLAYLQANPDFVRFIERHFKLQVTGDPQELMQAYAHEYYTSRCLKPETVIDISSMVKWCDKKIVQDYIETLPNQIPKYVLMTLLISAASSGDLDLFRSLRVQALDCGFIPRRYSYDYAYIDDTCVSYAAKQGHLHIIAYMRQCGVRILNSDVICGLIEGGHLDMALSLETDNPTREIGGYVTHGSIEFLDSFMTKNGLTELNIYDSILCIDHEDMYRYISLLLMSSINQCHSKSEEVRQLDKHHTQIYGKYDVKRLRMRRLPSLF